MLQARHAQLFWAAACIWLVGLVMGAKDASGQQALASVPGVSRGDLGEDASVAVKGPGDYKKHSQVPKHLTVSQRLVTASWVRCKMACDSDKACAGFKFTPMANKRLPLCELLATPGGNFMKNDFRSREAITKKLQVAKELLQKSKDSHKRSSNAAVTAQEKLHKLGKKIKSKAGFVEKSRRSEANAKSQLRKARRSVKRHKSQVQELKKKLDMRLKGFKSAEKEVAAKTGKKLKGTVESAEKAAEKAAEKVAEKKGKLLGRKKQSILDSVNGLTKEKRKLTAAEEAVAKSNAKIQAKAVLLKHLESVNSNIAELKEKMAHANLELKYKDNPKRLQLEKERLQKKISKRKHKLTRHVQKSKRELSREKRSKKSLASAQKRVKEFGKFEAKVENGVEKGEAKVLNQVRAVKEEETRKMVKAAQKLGKSKNDALKAVAAANKLSHEVKHKQLKSKMSASSAVSKLLKNNISMRKRYEDMSTRLKRLQNRGKQMKHKVKHFLNEKREAQAKHKALRIRHRKMEGALQRQKESSEEVKQKRKAGFSAADDQYKANKKKISELAVQDKSSALSVFIKQLSHKVAAAQGKLQAEKQFRNNLNAVQDSFTREDVSSVMLKIDKAKKKAISDMGKQSASAAKSSIKNELSARKDYIKKLDSTSDVKAMYNKLQKELKSEQQKLKALKASKPALPKIVSGEIASLKLTHSRPAVQRLEKRIDRQLSKHGKKDAKVISNENKNFAHAKFLVNTHSIRTAQSKQKVQQKIDQMTSKIQKLKKSIAIIKTSGSGTPAQAFRKGMLNL